MSTWFSASAVLPALRERWSLSSAESSTHFRTGRGLALGVMIGALTVGSAMPHLVNGLGGLPWEAVVLVTSAMTVAGGLVAIRRRPRRSGRAGTW